MIKYDQHKDDSPLQTVKDVKEFAKLIDLPFMLIYLKQEGGYR